MVFILIVIGILLIILNALAIKKEGNSFSSILKREESITNRDYDVEIISIRRDLAESILDIQKEMEEIKESIENIRKNKGNYLKNIEEKIKVADISIDNIKSENENNIVNNIEYKDEGVISQINFNIKTEKNNKVDEVKRLVKNGLTDEEICEEMSIGKGEVLLIKGLFRN